MLYAVHLFPKVHTMNLNRSRTALQAGHPEHHRL